MIKKTIMEVLPDVWPMLIIIMIIISSLRITYLITKHKKFQLHKELIYLRYFEDKTQSEVASLLGMNQVEVSRTEKKTLKRIRNNYQNVA